MTFPPEQNPTQCKNNRCILALRAWNCAPSGKRDIEKNPSVKKKISPSRKHTVEFLTLSCEAAFDNCFVIIIVCNSCIVFFVLFGLSLLFVFVPCNVFMLWCLRHVLRIMLSCSDDLWTPETLKQVSFGSIGIFNSTIWTEILTLTVQSISVLLFLKDWSSSSTSAWLWRGKWRTASMADTSGCVCCKTLVAQVCVWCGGAGEPWTHRAESVMFTHQLVPYVTKAHLKFMKTRGAADVDAA